MSRAERLASVIAKVRKLRALATSANVHEAAAAAGAAERLLAEHDLSEAEIEAAHGAEPSERAEIAVDPLDVHGATITRWRASLGSTLCKAHGCTSYLQATINRVTQKREWHFIVIGRPSDVQIVRYMHAWLTAEITRLGAREGKGQGKSWRNAFNWGAVAGIAAQLTAAQVDARKAASSAALAIVDARLDQARALKPGGLKPASKVAPVRDATAFARGREAGSRLHMGSALASSGSKAKALGS